MDDLDPAHSGGRRSRHRHLGTLQSLVKEAVGRFILGSVLGYAWEKLVAPDLPGATRLPVRPIYGLGAVFARSSFSENCFIATALEAVAHNQNPSLWNYDESDPLTVSNAVKADNMAKFGLAMTLANNILKKAGL